MLPIPCAYLVAAIGLGLLAPALDTSIGGHLQAGVGIGEARDVLSSLATGMIAFTGLVVSSVLVAVQFAAGQYSPRLVLWFRHDQLVKHAIGSFFAAPVFALVALQQLEHHGSDRDPNITVVLALALLVGAVVLFLALLQRVLDGLRPRSLYRGVAREGVRAARALYPVALDAPRRDPSPGSAVQTASQRELMVEHGAGVIASFDTRVLVSTAAQAGVTVELVPGIGEFISRGQPLLRIYGDGAVDEDILRRAIVVSDERTIEQDPAFAIRIIVDTAIRALSPAVNDPTTGAQSIDALEVLMRELGARDLDLSRAVDEDGTTRVLWPSPGWSELLDLAFTEIRMYGAGAVQVTRRLKAALLDLRDATPPRCHEAIDRHLRSLQESVQRAHPPGSAELAIGTPPDRMGLGQGHYLRDERTGRDI